MAACLNLLTYRNLSFKFIKESVRMKSKQGPLKKTGDAFSELEPALATIEKADRELRNAVEKALKHLSEETLLKMLEEVGLSSVQTEYLHLAMRKGVKSRTQKIAPKPAKKRKTTPKKTQAAERRQQKSAGKKAVRPETEGPPCTKKIGCIRGLNHKGRCYRKGIAVEASKEEKKAAPPPKPPPMKKPQPRPARLEEASDTRSWLPCPDPAKCFHPDGKGHAGDHQPNWVEPKEKCFIRSCGRERGHKLNHYPKSLILAQ